MGAYKGSRGVRAGLMLAAVVTVLTAVTAGADTVTVSIDKSRTFQTMDGNGFMGSVKPWKVRSGPFYVDADITSFLDSLINVLGVTLHRWFLDCCDSSPSPGEYVIHDAMRYFFEQAQHLKTVAESNNEWYGVCPTVLTAPAYLKENNACTGGVEGFYSVAPDNTLLEDKYGEFGDVCATFVRMVADTFGIVPCAFSLQNEPQFNEPYSCTVFRNGAHYRDMFKEAAPKVHALGLGTRIFATEVGGDLYKNWTQAILDDPGAEPHLDRVALHGYGGNGIDVPSPGTYLNIRPVGGRPLWVSETAHRIEETDTHGKALDMVGRCFAYAYGQGSVSAWIQVGIFANTPGSRYPGGFVSKDNGQPLPAYWIACQFWRFIRPGMQRVLAECSNDSLFVLAFKDDRVSSMSTILMNMDTVDHTVRLSISGGDVPGQFDMRRTTETEHFVSLGTVAPTEAIEVPARSVVSLGYNYIGTGVPPGEEPQAVSDTCAPVRSAAPAPASYTRVYDLRGRLVSRTGMVRDAAGALSAAAYCVDNGARRSLIVPR